MNDLKLTKRLQQQLKVHIELSKTNLKESIMQYNEHISLPHHLNSFCSRFILSSTSRLSAATSLFIETG